MMSRMKENRKKRSRLRVVLTAVLITAVISACGSSKSALYDTGLTESAAVAEEYAYDTSAAYDADMALSGGAGINTVIQNEMAEEAAEEPVSEGGYEQEAATAPAGRKLIKTVNISAETEDFDTLVPDLQRQVEALGGYIESVSVYDVNSYYVEDQQVKQRCADMTARVPVEKLNGFLAGVAEQTNVTSRSENVEDVTLQYVDLESHKKALLTEQERLLTLMEQAESVEDIIAIEGRLSEVRYQLESMESQLRTYDNRIDYSTVYFNIAEVRKYSPSQTATVWQRIGNGFMKSLEDIGFGIRDFAIGFVIDIPYFVFWIVIIAAAVFVLRIVRKVWKKRAAKSAAVGGENGTRKQGMGIEFRWPVRRKPAKDKPEASVEEPEADKPETSVNKEQAKQ